MKRNNRNKQGFTLAELLVVVAIIAVLVAIAIPIFTSQLEKSREATDAANIRSQYAQVMTDAITEGGNVNGKDVYGVINLNQKKENWQDTTTGTNLHGLFQEVDGHPVPNGTAWVEYKASGSKVILHYEVEGSSNGDSSSGGTTGGSGGSSGGTGDTSSSFPINRIENSAISWKMDEDNDIVIGNIYSYNNQYYIAVSSGKCEANKGPKEGWHQAWLVQFSGKILTYSENINNSKFNVTVNNGDVYQDSDLKLYVWKGPSNPYGALLPASESNWSKINS